jgi:hypothetical protein
MKQPYTTPSIEALGSLRELTAESKNNNGCKASGGGKEKTFTKTDGFNHGQTGCLS